MKIFYYIAFAQALLATLGSLFFSEIMQLPPCLLCWWQRIFMYPLVLIIPVGILRKDKNLPFYVLPLTLAGGTVAMIHNLLYYGILPHAVVPCSLGVSCTTKFFELFGFVTIPLLSLLAFLVISGCMVLILREEKWKLKK